MKNFAVTFSPVAIDDIEQAAAYYEDMQPGLGKRFASQLLLTLNAIKRNPFFASVRYDYIRCAQVRNFLTSCIIIFLKKNYLLSSWLFTQRIWSRFDNATKKTPVTPAALYFLVIFHLQTPPWFVTHEPTIACTIKYRI